MLNLKQKCPFNRKKGFNRKKHAGENTGGLHEEMQRTGAQETRHTKSPEDHEKHYDSHLDNEPTRTRGSTETYIHTQGRQGQLNTGGTREDWCRQSQTGSEERKH